MNMQQFSKFSPHAILSLQHVQGSLPSEPLMGPERIRHPCTGLVKVGLENLKS